jgi:integrase
MEIDAFPLQNGGNHRQRLRGGHPQSIPEPLPSPEHFTASSEIIRRHHLHPKTYGEAIRRAAEKAGIAKRVTTHALRHAFATHLSQGGTDVRTLQELLGHADVKTTEFCTHAANIGNEKGVRSPLDAVVA